MIRRQTFTTPNSCVTEDTGVRGALPPSLHWLLSLHVCMCMIPTNHPSIHPREVFEGKFGEPLLSVFWKTLHAQLAEAVGRCVAWRMCVCGVSIDGWIL